MSKFSSKDSLILLLFLIFSSFQPNFQSNTLDIKVTGIKTNSGTVIVEIYKDKANWLEKPLQKLELSSDSETKVFSFSVPYGEYAVTVYQDVNLNGETDMNFLSIPKEPVGFGNNYKPFGEPKFESSLVEYSANKQPEPIELYKVF